MGAIGAYEAGRDRNRQVMQQNKQDMFAQYLPGALKGDQQALAGAQQNATPEQQMQLQNALAQMEDRQLQQTLQQQEKFSRLAQWADTPEKWAQATQMAEAEGLKGASQVPFEQRGAKLAGMLSVKEQLDQEWKRREFQLQERNVNSQIGARNAAAATARGSAPPGAPPTYRKPPASTEGKDATTLKEFSQQADAAANIAALLQGAKPALDRGVTGPGFGIKRTVAGVLSALPDLGVERALTGENRSQSYVDDYDRISMVSKSIGIEELAKMGGSDTQLELKTAIQTTVSPDASPAENKKRFNQRIAAAEILSKKAQLAAEWVNTFGSLGYAAPNGTTWQKYWPTYQKQQWGEFLKKEAARIAEEEARARGETAPPGRAGSSVIDEADAIVSGGIGRGKTRGSF